METAFTVFMIVACVFTLVMGLLKLLGVKLPSFIEKGFEDTDYSGTNTLMSEHNDRMKEYDFSGLNGINHNRD